MGRIRHVALGAMAALAAVSLGSGCASKGTVGNGGSRGSTGKASSSSGTGAGSTTGATSSTGSTGSTGPATDFPSAAQIEDGLPPVVATLFAQAPDGGATAPGPCLAEPTFDAMVPRNWTPLRFEWTPAPGENVFELRLHVDNQQNDLRIYTTQNVYILDPAIWAALANHSGGHDVRITLRGATLAGGTLSPGPSLGAQGLVHLAPVAAPGTVVYWTPSGGSAFKGFSIGATAPTPVITPALASPTSSSGQTATCVACHTSSPDGNLVIYTRDTSTSRAVDARQTDGGTVDPSVISPTALTLLSRNKQTAPVLSAAHSAATDAVAISAFIDPTLTSNQTELIWTNLHAQDVDGGWGILARTGDSRQAGSPAWRHDGTKVAYVSAPSIGEGVIASGGNIDIYTVPYNGGAGGAATPLPGASDPTFREFYPVYSPGDSLLAFNRIADPSVANSYNQPLSEIFVVPGEGGTARRLTANDPPACTGFTSPGLTNSWARWAPSAETVGGQRYYWLVFSSKRRPASQSGGALLPQLYVAAIVTQIAPDGTETVAHDYPALYVGSQDPTESNHTPAWDNFKLVFQ
jgi:hypothetical protein